MSPSGKTEVITRLADNPFQVKTEDEQLRDQFFKERGFVKTTDKGELFDNSMSLISQWEPSSEVFFLQWGRVMAAAMAAPLTVVLNSDIARAHRMIIRHRHMIPFYTMNFYMAGVSCYFGALTHLKNHVIPQDPPCSVCREIRGVALQTVPGVGMAAVAGLASGRYLMANRFALPKNEATWRWALRMLSRNRNTLMLAAAAHSIGIAFVHHMEEREWGQLNVELVKRMTERPADAIITWAGLGQVKK